MHTLEALEQTADQRQVCKMLERQTFEGDEITRTFASEQDPIYIAEEQKAAREWFNTTSLELERINPSWAVEFGAQAPPKAERPYIPPDGGMVQKLTGVLRSIWDRENCEP